MDDDYWSKDGYTSKQEREVHGLIKVIQGRDSTVLSQDGHQSLQEIGRPGKVMVLKVRTEYSKG